MHRQPRIVIVTRETRLRQALKRWSTRGQAQFVLRRARAARFLKQADEDAAGEALLSDAPEFLDLDLEDQTYQASVGELSRSLDLGLPVQVLDRTLLPTFDADSVAAVVVVGQDGLVANTAKYVPGVPIVGVNPDPQRFDGVLLPFQPAQTRDAVAAVLAGRARQRAVSMAQAVLQDGQTLLAFNDLFVGVRTHVSARHQLHWRGRSERQSSSGLLVATGAGSTGWMSSVMNMARGVSAWMGAPAPPTLGPRLKWEDRRLVWAVREPFVSRTSQASLVAGDLHDREQLLVESENPQGGVIFSDGVESDFLEFPSGAVASIGLAPQQALLVVP